MTDHHKKTLYVVDRYHEHRPEATEKVVPIGGALYGEIFDDIEFSSWAKKRLMQSVLDVRWLQHAEYRFIEAPEKLKEMLRGL